MTDQPAPAYEIDMGESHPETPEPAASPDTTQPSPEEREAERLLGEVRTVALAQWEGAALARQRVDIEALILVGLCGEGVGAILRLDHWGSGASLAMLVTLASLAAAAWMWRRTRHPAELLAMMPMPFDPSLVARNAPLDAGQRAASRQRREAEFERIRVHAAELSACQRRLRSAVQAALGGAFCGWLAGIISQPGIPVLIGSAAAGTAAVAGWLASDGTWPRQRSERVFLGVIPAVALLFGLLCGASPWSAIGGPLVAAAAGWHWRRRLLPFVVPAT